MKRIVVVLGLAVLMAATVALTAGAALVQAENATTPLDIVPYGAEYKYEVVGQGAGSGFEQPGFDDSGWLSGNAPFAEPIDQDGFDLCGYDMATHWPRNTDILLRKKLDLPAGTSNLKVSVRVDNDVQVSLNGQDISSGLQQNVGCANKTLPFVFDAPDSL